MAPALVKGRDTEPFLSLGKSPLANNLVSKEDLDKEEETFPLELCFDKELQLVHLNYVVPPEVLFKNYVYVTSTSNTFRVHFTQMAEDLVKMYSLGSDSFVIDVGSNDGLLLKGFKNQGCTVLGIEPATNIAEIAEKDGIPTVNDFITKDSVTMIVEKHGKADVVTANNVFAHNEDIENFALNVKELLKDDGVFVIECQYILDTIDMMTFDNVYHEHIYYYSLTSLANIFKTVGMEVFDVSHVDSHGGSLRVHVQKEGGKHAVSENVTKMLATEEERGLKTEEVYKEFAEKVYDVKKKMNSYLKDIKAEGKTVAAYGAPAKSTTLLNFCEITSNEIDYIVDDSPLKIGLHAPGTKIPIVSSEMLDTKQPDYVLILAWNFAKEILEKTKKYKEKGVKFIIPLPEPKIVE